MYTLAAVPALLIFLTGDPSGDALTVGDAGHTKPEPMGSILAQPGNDCATADDLGIFGPEFPQIITGWDTTNSGNNFENATATTCWDEYGSGGNDQVIKFQVSEWGIWNFWTCGLTQSTAPGALPDQGWDTSLQIFRDGGAGCPTTQAAIDAQQIGCNGDGCGAPYFESDMYVSLSPDETYYLVLDSWASWYHGTAWVVFYNAPCFCCAETQEQADAFCNDGNACNGAETCDMQFGGSGLCEPGEGSPCLSYQACIASEEPNEYTCEDPDPCMAYFQHDQNSTYFGPARANGDEAIADEIAYRVDTGRELVSYSHCVSGRQECEFDFTSSLWTVDPTDGDNGCLPLEKIAGTECAYHQAPDPGGTPCHYNTCTAGAGTILPENTQDPFDPVDERCGIDLYMVLEFSDERDLGCDSHGAGLAAHLPTVGSSPFALFNPLPSGGGYNAGRDQETFEWGLLSYSDPSVTDFANSDICTVPVGACCYADGGCDLVQSEADCDGTWEGISTLPDLHSCDDPDGDGFFSTCDNCPYARNLDQADCNGNGIGDACEIDERLQDADGDGCCNLWDGCPNDPLKPTDTIDCVRSNELDGAPGQCGCGVEDIDSDNDGVANCIDECPLDSGKSAPGCCGCGFADTDVDGDGYVECAPDAEVQDTPMCPDTCPNADDAIFGPCEPDVIPTLSQWGLIVTTLLLMVVAKVYLGRPEVDAG